MAATGTVKTLNVDLPAEIFDARVSIPLIHQVVVAQQAAARQGTHSTKTRGEVSGGGRKPYKQKGTGRARQGSTRAPQFAGGGTVHGPQPRAYDQRTPKKMKAAALRGALTDRARNGRIHVIDALVSGDKPSTKAALAALSGLVADRNKFLVVLERNDAITWLSLRNAPEVHIVAVDQLNTYDVIASDDVVFTKGAFDLLVAKALGTDTGAQVAPAAPAKPVAKEAPADETPVEAPAADDVVAEEAPAEEVAVDEAAPALKAFAAVADDTVPGAAQPGPNGEAPEGYTIKGNKDSMKFHAPGGRWFDATVAEVWFKTAEDAEAAGFVEAGKKKKEDDK